MTQIVNGCQTSSPGLPTGWRQVVAAPRPVYRLFKVLRCVIGSSPLPSAVGSEDPLVDFELEDSGAEV